MAVAARSVVLALALAIVGCSPEEPGEIVLEADGLGVVSFGDSVAEALPLLEVTLGSPSVDQTLEPPWPDPAASWHTTSDQPCTQATGYKCSAFLRRVVWENRGLAVVFSDVRGYTRALAPIVDEPHFVAWEHWPPDSEVPFALRSGVGPGNTVRDLREAHSSDLTDIGLGCPYGTVYATVVNGGVHVLPGNDPTLDLPLDAATKEADAARQITFMWAGFHKTCHRPPFEGPGPHEIDVSEPYAPACGWLDDANVDLALHELLIHLSDEDSAEPPEQVIVTRLVDECPFVDHDTIERVCHEYRLATCPSEVAYRHRIHGSYYADKQTALHWRNATWTAAWMLAVQERPFDGSSVEAYLAKSCPTK